MPVIDNELVADSNPPLEPVTCSVYSYISDVLDKNLKIFGDSIWMTDVSTKRSMKYSELKVAVGRYASALWERGFRPGDAVLLMASNFIEIAIAMFGTWKAGGKIACLTLNLLPQDIKTRMNDTCPKFVITDELRAGRVLQAVKELDYVKEIVVIGQTEGCTAFKNFIDNDGKECPENTEVDLDSMVWLMYSSGTTGVPKGIVHTHRTIVLILKNIVKTGQSLINQRFLFINLMINSGGMGLALLTTLSHAHCYTLSRSTDEDLLEAIDEVKPNMVSAFSSQIVWICRHLSLDKYDVSSVSVIITGGSSMNPIYERQIFDKLPNLKLLDVVYGLSETSICARSSLRFPDFPKDKQQAIERHLIGSSGKLCPNCRLKVVDERTGDKLGPGKVGEICIKTPYMLKEYLNNPKATRELIIDGWCHTGDQGYFDAEGNIFICGRYKELIKYRMAHVLPTNIEKYLLTHPAVEDAGVVGLPDDVDGELPLAFVVIKPGFRVTTEEIIAFIEELVPDEERLRGGVRFVDKIPRNDLYKIIRRKLSEWL